MPIVILVAVVIIVGVVIALRSVPSQEQNTGKSGPRLGLWCLVGGFAALVGVAMVGQATFRWLSGFDPPGWLRIAAFWLFPVSVIASAILGTLSLKQNAERRLGITGLVLAVLSVGAFFAILASADY